MGGGSSTNRLGLGITSGGGGDWVVGILFKNLIIWKKEKKKAMPYKYKVENK